MAMELQGKASSTSAVPDVGRDFDDPLGWWQGTLQFMTLLARDILAIPGSSMTALTTALDIVTKESLKSELGEGVNYTDFIKIHIK
ncbi:hypothetical protein C8J57DRAFT_1535392 [Mycena rebaudengoi]|nr:hypothetical protein C8J57DRAFT_1535392 [Mycena rebaudengoi]